MTEQSCIVLGISLIVVRNPLTGKFLAVNESNGTWWLPGGKVDPPETFSEAAVRECLQEAGVQVQLKGLLRMEQSEGGDNFVRMRVILYGQPIDPNAPPKSIADKESLGAAYLTLQEINTLRAKWRGNELIDWVTYLSNSGKVYPLNILNQFRKPIQKS